MNLEGQIFELIEDVADLPKGALVEGVEVVQFGTGGFVAVVTHISKGEFKISGDLLKRRHDLSLPHNHGTDLSGINEGKEVKGDNILKLNKP